jgi:hypothetical protein
MTVILYSSKHREMAADTMISADGARVSNEPKILRLKNGALLGSAGDGDTRDLEYVLGRSSIRNLPSRGDLIELELDAAAIIVYPAGEVCEVACYREYDQWRGAVYRITGSPFVAVGVGAAHALGALWAGATPRKAAEIACEICLGCGVPVHVEPLVKVEKAAKR